MTMQHISDYFGTSFATGTDGDWRTNPTLANILRACNPRLTGDNDGDNHDYESNNILDYSSKNYDNDEGSGMMVRQNILLPACYLRI